MRPVLTPDETGRGTVAGTVPVSIDGRSSKVRSGDASAYNRRG